MSYYLGKVGRAGAHILSSCKDLYNDVNAAYLTGAVDIVVIRQKDGSLKSTPFHVRFGKLGVLRTGDLKEVEIEINGIPVDLHMNIDETGRGFFSKRKHSETGTDSDSSDKVQIALEMDQLLHQSLSENDVISLEYSENPTCHKYSSVSGNSEIAKQRSDSLLLSSYHTVSDISLMSAYNKRRCDSLTVDSLASRVCTARGEDTQGVEDLSEAIATSDAANTFTAQEIPNGVEKSSDGVLESQESTSDLPLDQGVLSDSGLEKERCSSRYSGISRTSALSDTEVEVQDRMSSNIWEWSAAAKRKRQTSLGEPSAHVSTGLSEDELKDRLRAQPAPVDRVGFWSTLTRILKRKSRQRDSSLEDGIYLDDIDYESMDPNELSKFFPSGSSPAEVQEVTGGADQYCSSGLGTSPTSSPSQSSCDVQKEDTSKLMSTLDDCAFSSCGGLVQGNITEERFLNSQISYSDMCTDPCAVISNPNLVVRVNGKYYNWQTAAALILPAVTFLQVLPEKRQEKIVQQYMPKKTRQSFWSFWGRGKNIDDDVISKAMSEGFTPVGSPHKWEHSAGRERSDAGDRVREAADMLSSDEDQEAIKLPIRPRQRSLRKRKSNFTTSLSSDELVSLPLKSGANSVVFSITTKYQGTAKAECTLYLWNYFDKIVVSDIDGTITRSDVAGQVLPLIWMDWTQNGVVELFCSLAKNGYRIMYLSARAIGQAGYTKEFLRNVKRGKSLLPDGPVFLAPFSLYKAFKKEVIEKKPEEFKIDCLKQIRDLFPDDFNPFYAGFGNKSSDVKSYVEVNIPQSRIFTVNHKGHLKHEMSISFQSNYMDLMGFVDAQFPPLKLADSKRRDETDSAHIDETYIDASNIKEDFNMFNFWRDPMGLVLPTDLPELT